MALLIDHRHAFRIGKEDAHDRDVAFDMRAEIVEGVGMSTLDHRIGFGRERGHVRQPSERERMPPGSRQRDMEPIRPVRKLVFDFVECFLQQEEIEQRSASSGSCGQSRGSARDSR